MRERKMIQDEEGPSLFPGMEELGIGSIRRMEERKADEFEEDARFERALLDYDDDSYDDDSDNDGDYDEDYEEPESVSRKGKVLDRESERLIDGRELTAEDLKNLRPVGRGPYLFISCTFILLFLLLIGQAVYFNLYQKDAILDSPYNRRQNSLSDSIIRGRILSEDGEALAYTYSGEDGYEERIYPYANMYAHTVGYASHGKNGIESVANYQLMTSHTNLIDQIANDFSGKKNQGDDVVTTLNTRMTQYAWDALGDYRGAVIVMDPKTGAILAMVAKPNFDPNTLAETWEEMVSDSSNSQLLNRATQGLYPPGSTFKIVTTLAYMRSKHNLDKFRYDCTGIFEIGNTTVHCYKDAVHGEEDFKYAFAHSCNTAFAQIGLDTGAKALGDTAEKLLIGKELPSDLYASKSRYSLTEQSGEAELVQTAFGQGKTLVTPYQMALIVAAIANDGVLMKPYLIDHAVTPTGKILNQTKPSKYTTLMTKSETQVLKQLMKAVVDDGSASALSGRSYEVAGKTGSAEFTKSDGTVGTHSWFVGYTGGDNPDLVISVLAENGGAGSSTAVPIAERILDSWYSEW